MFNLIDVGKLLEVIAEFECCARTTVELSLWTAGKVKLSIFSHDDQETRARTFPDIHAALKFFD